MRRLILAASLVLAVAVPGTVAASLSGSTPARAATAHTASTASIRHARRVRRCGGKLFTVKMAERASHATFAGTRHVTRHDWLALFYFARCQRNPRAGPFVHHVYRTDSQAHARRIYWANPEHWPTAKASWFNDSTTACGVDASTYQWGTASEQYPCGTQVDMERNGVRITVTVIDYGPDPSTGRMWDLTPHAMQTLDGMGAGVIDVHYRVQ